MKTRGIAAQNLGLIVVRIDGEADQHDIRLTRQVVLQLGHVQADLRTGAGTAGENEGRDPNFARERLPADGKATSLGQAKLADSAEVVVVTACQSHGDGKDQTKPEG